MSTRASKSRKPAAAHDDQRQLREVNAALLVSSVRQHELTQAAERDAAELRLSQDQLQALNEALEQRVAERTAALTKEQRRLRALVKELGNAEARERKRLATELHDHLAQLLAVCKMKVSGIEASAPPGSPTAVEAGAVKQLLGEGIEYTRTLMSDLRPNTLNEDNLAAAMQWVARRMERHGLSVRVEDDGDPKPLEETLLTLIFDSVRELLFNVVKHAGTRAATVSLRRAGGEARVTVSDAGAGFDPSRQATPSDVGGFGLFSISERLSLLGGLMEVESAPGRGACIRLIVPLLVQRGGRPPTTRRNRKKMR